MFDIIKNLSGFMDLFKKGKEVANVEAWKNGTIAVNSVLAVLGSIASLAKGFGYNLGVDDATLQSLAAGLVSLAGLFNAVMHVITSARVGLSSGSKPA